MDWHILALIAPIFFALAKFIDKYLVEERFPNNPSIVPVIESAGWAAVGVPLWAYTGFAIPDRAGLLIALGTGFTLIWAGNLYWKGISRVDTSTFIILIQMQPIFVLVMSYLALSERITTLQLVGFFIIVFATIGVSLRRESVGSFQLSGAVLPVLLFSLVVAGIQVLMKAATAETAVISFMAFQHFGVGLGGLSIISVLPGIRKDTFERARRLTWLDVETIFLKLGVVLLIARIMLITAISLGPVSLVRAFASTQIFWGVILGMFFGRFIQRIFKEDITRQGLIRKASFSVMMFTGVVMAA